ncbi:MAPK kinase substrate protein At1g80180-like [Trifolium pratense]|uniref:MAPK kinase substrate protein At1g80180-like n=1 Tax=Trifolium pratense TaxID=57577 RepID=UPI001E693BCE|nr:MAPK kinase substrate protein At1g80180-like [Trifolium pratense]
MASLPRSEVSFRRSGSSGLVWDDKFLSGELNKINQQQKQKKNNSKELQVRTTMQRTRSTGSGQGYRTGKVSPAIEPPSPKVSACGFCSPFGKKGQRSRRLEQIYVGSFTMCKLRNGNGMGLVQ